MEVGKATKYERTFFFLILFCSVFVCLFWFFFLVFSVCFLFVLFFVLFCFVLFFFFFFLLFTLQKQLKFVWVYQNGNFLQGKKSGKMILPPQKNFSVTPLTLVIMFCWTYFYS